jgi:hypothetical protein
LGAAVPSGLFRQIATAEKKQNITGRSVGAKIVQTRPKKYLTQHKIERNTNENDDEVDSAKGTSKRLKNFVGTGTINGCLQLLYDIQLRLS